MSKPKLTIKDEINLYGPLKKSETQLMFEKVESLKDRVELLTNVVEKQGMTIKMLDKFIFEKLALGRAHSQGTE